MTSYQKFRYAMRILKQVEFSNRDDLLLHKNKHEATVTFYGIYQKAHPGWKRWNEILKILQEEGGNLKRASYRLATMQEIIDDAYYFYNHYFWNKMNLGLIEDKEIAAKLFLFGVNVGTKTAARLAQGLVGTTQDGILGKITAKAINEFRDFRIAYEIKQKYHYEAIVAKDPSKEIYLNGWLNRIKAV